MFDRLPLPLAEFVREALTRSGGEWEEDADGVLLAMLPGEPDFRRITFEPEVAREEAGVELAIHGSRLVEALAEAGLARGRLARAYGLPNPVPPAPLNRAYRLSADRIERTEWVERAWTTWVFAFGSRYAGEFRQDALWLCAVDGASGRLVRRFEEAFGRLVMTDSGPAPEGDRPFAESYAVAREEILPLAAAGFRAAQGDSDDDLGRELERLERYYGGLIREMGEDMERWPPEDPKRTAILVRIQATRADRDRAAAEARERHRLTLELEVVGALGIVYPRRVATVTLADEKGRSVDVEASWDPIFERNDPLSCPACARPSYALQWRGRSADCGCGD